MFRLKSILCCILVVFATHFVIGQGTRKHINDFLNIGAGARGIGMSKSIIASINDANATYWNPAVLADQPRDFQFTGMHSEYFAGLSKYNFFSFSKKLNQGKSSVGFSLVRFGTDNIPNTFLLKGVDGSINYDNISYFSAVDYAYLFSFSKKLNKFSYKDKESYLGINLKVINRKVDNAMAKGWGIGGDVAYAYRTPKTKLGIVLRDATTTYVNWNFNFTPEQIRILQKTGNQVLTSSYEVALPQLHFGFGKDIRFTNKIHALFETNIINNFDGKRNTLFHVNTVSIDPNIGIELSYMNMIFLRSGIGNFQTQKSYLDSTKKNTVFTPTLGCGLKVGSLNFDYAFATFENSSNNLFSHFVSISLGLKQKKSSAEQKNAEAPSLELPPIIKPETNP